MPKLKIQKPNNASGTSIVRFAPEPSGYLHIGHTKPIFLNETIREKFNGKFILRFDDTNPQKESIEYEKAITEDLGRLGISIDQVTHSSDYFDKILEYACQIIQNGDAYLDDTPTEQMKDERHKKIPSKFRNVDPQTNLDIFKTKFQTDSTSNWCLRAKISHDNVNPCLRDPVLMRACNHEHIRYGTKYKVYPTYEFSCPIVDHLEQITHAARANEYMSHSDTYKWICKKLGLTKPHIVHFSKISFQQTIMSKRYLKQLVEAKLVDGWDDPRLPTIRGLWNHGLTKEALKKYIVDMGLNNKNTLTSWDKLWATNKKHIDRVIPRYSSVNFTEKTQLTLDNYPLDSSDSELQEFVADRHPSNKQLGWKKMWKSKHVFVNQYDSDLFEIGDRVGLLKFAVVELKNFQNGVYHCEISEDQDYKTAKHKINWINTDPSTFTKANLVTYGPLITCDHMDHGDNVLDIFNEDSRTTMDVLIEKAVEELKTGELLQLERRGYYRYNGNNEFIQVPDGRKKAMIN